MNFRSFVFLLFFPFVISLFFSCQDVATLVWSVIEPPSFSMDLWSFMFVILKAISTVETKNGRTL